MQCHELRRLSYVADKSFVLHSGDDNKKTNEKFKFEMNEVWDVDILVSTGDGKARDHSARTTIYKKNDTLYQLKMKTSRRKRTIEYNLFC